MIELYDIWKHKDLDKIIIKNNFMLTKEKYNYLINELEKNNCKVLLPLNKNGIMQVKKDDCVIQINMYRNFVITNLKHPKKGKTILKRAFISFEELIAIINNVRIHTGKGKYIKKSI